MTIKEFAIFLRSFVGTEIQLKSQIENLFKSETIQFFGIVKNIRDKNISLQSILNLDKTLERSFNSSYEDFGIIADSISLEELLKISIHDLIKVNVTPKYGESAFPSGYYKTQFYLSDFEIVNYSVVTLTNYSGNIYDCYINNEYKGPLITGESPTWYITGDHPISISVRQKRGFLFKPSLFEVEFPFERTGRQINWRFPV